MWPFSRRAEKRTSGDWLAFADLLGGSQTASGVTVTQQNVIEHPAVYRCLDLNSSTIGSFPVDCLVKRDKKRLPYREPLWLKQPNDEQNFNELLAEAVCSQDQYDSAFILKATDDSGHLVGLSVLDPNVVEMKRVDLGRGPVVVYDVMLASGKVRLAANEVLRIKAGLPIPGALRGVSPTVAARELIGAGLAARQFGANFFGSGATLSGVIETAKDMNEETANRLKEAFTKKHGGVSKSHAIGILSGGAKWVPLSVKPDESQNLQTIKQTDVQIAHLFGIPPNYVTDTDGVKGYVTGVYAQQRLWYQSGLYPRIRRNEMAFSSLLPGSAYIRLNVNAWLRMDPEQQTAFFAAGQQGEYLAIEEIRALLDMNPEPEGTVLKSVQWQHDGDPPPDGADTDTDNGPASAGSSVKEAGQ